MQILNIMILFVSLILSDQQTVSPHGAAFKISCSTCHSSKGWQLDKAIYSFNHNSTNLPLVGQHAVINCRQCHTTLIFKDAKNECFQCHSDIHQSTVGLDCSRCHTSASWLVSNVSDIHRKSRFPLVGPHQSADCIQCHKSESLVRFDVPGVNCIDCHRSNYLASTNPNHSQVGFPEDCTFCHPKSSNQWTAGVTFSHTGFPLDQGHKGAKCIECHTTGKYSDTKSDCYSCHEKDYTATKTPDHNSSKFSIICQDCHTKSPGWKPVTFNHNSFPLALGHSTPGCIDCHKGGVYKTTSKDCYTCHQPDYTAATNPNHVASAFSKECQNCHNLTPGWKPSVVNHTRFPLTLGHSQPACIDCHKNGNYTALSPDCFSCHQPKYVATTNPNHVLAGIPTACATCHSTIPGWKPATYTHTSFPLTLGHASPTCNDCHKGNYTTTSKDCFSCHVNDYNTSSNPSHKTLAFSTVCTQCHTTIPGWAPATYTQHDAQMFPIYSGKHKGKWTKCSDCHTNTANYALFDCKRCHSNEHRTNNYSNAQCYTCHPRGT